MLSVARSSFYYVPVPISKHDIETMHLIDRIHTKWPCYGVVKMWKFIKRAGRKAGRDKIRKLLRQMGLKAIYPSPNTSKATPEHKKYPYLLKGLEITRVNQVWCTDITYIKLSKGFVYLVAIMDWHSRYVLSWKLSNTLHADFCVEALQEALQQGTPEVFNTDQGSQFTSKAFTDVLLERGIKISMDGRGRAFDNIFIERLWRTVKYDDVYIYDYQTISDAEFGLRRFFNDYCTQRLHQALDYKTPWEVHSGIEMSPENLLSCLI